MSPELPFHPRCAYRRPVSDRSAPRRRTAAQISYNMSRIRSSGSRIELRLAGALRQRRLRFKCQVRDLPGSPDFVLEGDKICIFCDSEFWHGFRWQEAKMQIKSNRAFWIAKIEDNMRRDRRVTRQLKSSGWKVIRLWERDILQRLKWCMNNICTVSNYT